MAEQWTKLEIEVSSRTEDSVTSFISDIILGGCLIQESGHSTVKIVAYLKDDEWNLCRERIQNFLKSLKDFFPDISEPRITTSPLKYQNWATVWKSKFKPIKVGLGLVVAPPWAKPKRLSGRIPIIIEPAEAFGTGTHETTQGCLTLMEQVINKIVCESRSCSLFDIGCGSGIISLAAYMLGASPVIAIDNDPIAVESAKKNSALNNLEGAIEIKVGNLNFMSGLADVVVANLDFLTLTGNTKKLVKLFREYLIVSGVTKPNWKKLKDKFQETGLRFHAEIVGKEWGSGLFAHDQSNEQGLDLTTIL